MQSDTTCQAYRERSLTGCVALREVVSSSRNSRVDCCLFELLDCPSVAHMLYWHTLFASRCYPG